MGYTGKKVLTKLVAIMAILALTMSDFVLVSANLVSYAVDSVKSTDGNVEFSAYFVDQNSEKVSKIEKAIGTADLKLYVEISVKDGYFDGQIKLGTSNFKIKNKILSDDVSKIESNTVDLKRINAGKNAVIELEIESDLPENMSLSLLSLNSEINLTGKSTTSKKTKDISTKSYVEVDWKSGEESKAETTLDLLTNKVFEIQGEQKRIVQLLLKSKLADNIYPVKSTKIEVLASQGAEEATVEARSTYATNGNASFDNSNYEYSVDEGKLSINIENNANNDGNIKFYKNMTDEFIITYIYSDELEEQATEFASYVTINTYDEVQKTSKNKVVLEEEKDGIITYDIENSEKEIYKGKIYTGENRSLESTTKINVNKAGIAQKLIVDEFPASYIADDLYGANIYFTQTKVSKSELEKIFGTDGYIRFLNSDGATLANVKATDNADNEGFIIVNYSIDVNAVRIETSEPISEGTLNIKNIKTIKETGYDRERIEKFTQIREMIVGSYDGQNTTEAKSFINLKDTSSKARLDVSNTSLSTTEKTNTRVVVTLETHDESKDLYKNPKLKVTLPKQVVGYQFTAKLLHGNGLTLAQEDIVKSKDGENLVCTFNLKGEQSKYVTDITEGTSLVIDFILEQNSLATTSKEEIKVNYTNEFAKTYSDNGEEKVAVNVIAKNPIILTNRIIELQIQASQEDKKDVELKIASEAQTLTNIMDVVNNETGKISNVKILGQYPTNSSKNNMGITVSTVQLSKDTEKTAKIYYSEVENATDDITLASNKWTEQKSENVRNYLLIIDSLDVGEKFTFGYNINVPANLEYNLSAEAGYGVSYKNEASNTSNTVKATTIELNTGKSAILEQKVIATVGGDEIKDGDEVKTGEIIKYTITVTNKGNEDATGISVIGSIPEGTNYIEYNKDIKRPESPVPDSEPDMFVVDTTKREVKFENITIKAKSETTFEYMVKVTSKEDKNAVCKIEIANQGKKLENNIIHKIEAADVEVTMLKSDSIYNEGEIKSGYSYRYVLKIKNTSNKTKKNLQVTLNLNDLVSLKRAYYLAGDDVLEFTEKTLTIAQINAGEEIELILACDINQPTDKLKEAEFSAIVSEGNTSYRSNKVTEKVDAIELQVNFASQSNSKAEGYLHLGDKVQYRINIKNVGKNDATKLEVRDELSDFLELESVNLNNQKAEYTKNEVYGEGKNYSVIAIPAPLKAGESASIIITAKVKELLNITNITKIVNKATIYNEIELASTDEIVYFIEKVSDDSESNGSFDNKEENKEDNQNDSGNTTNNNQNTINDNSNTSNTNGNNTNNNTNNNSTSTGYTITGTAWKDENENGSRDKGEALLAGINVRLLDIKSKKYITDSSGKEIVAKTNQEGLYTISNIPAGKYIAVFEYDTSKFMLTTYKADGVANDRNSDVILNTIIINGNGQQLATTDTLDIQNSIANIDIGFLEAKIFDLELDKYITKIVVTNNSGTSTYDYKDSTLAKVDIAAKDLSNSQVVVEYTIKVKNAGEVAGYVKNVVDYKSTELEFSSTLNKDWYAQGNNLYNASLANTKLEPGETKELKLILTKTMTESNTGLIGNTAEVAEAYNTRGAADKDSTPGNRVNKEDDMGQADLIIGVKTGAAISYVLITLSIIVVLGVASFLVSKKVLSKEIKF